MSMESNASFRSYQIILEQKQWGIKETCKYSPRATAMAFDRVLQNTIILEASYFYK